MKNILFILLNLSLLGFSQSFGIQEVTFDRKNYSKLREALMIFTDKSPLHSSKVFNPISISKAVDGENLKISEVTFSIIETTAGNDQICAITTRVKYEGSRLSFEQNFPISHKGYCADHGYVYQLISLGPK